MRTSQSANAAPAALATVDGWPVNVPGLRAAVSLIIEAARTGESFAAFTLNLDHLVKLRRSEAFRRAYRAARFVTADGAPVARLARLQSPRVERATGADLMVPLAQAAARNALPVFLFGSNAEVLQRAGRDLGERCDGALDIAGTEAPPYGFDPEGPEADRALERIAASGARVCFVALGAPKQEVFAARAVARGIGCGFVCIGASLDFLAGEQIRAPSLLRDNGLEWLWRLATSPRRLGWRYAQCAVLLADLTLLAPIRGMLARQKA